MLQVFLSICILFNNNLHIYSFIHLLIIQVIYSLIVYNTCLLLLLLAFSFSIIFITHVYYIVIHLLFI